MSDILFLLTANYPSHGEAFVEIEAPYLANSFEHVYVMSYSTSVEVEMPQNFTLITLPQIATMARKRKALKFLLSKNIWQEVLPILIKTPIADWKIVIASSLLSMKRAAMIKGVLEKQLAKHSSAKVCVYSYWADDLAIAVALLKKAYPQIKAISRGHRWDIYHYATARGNLIPMPLRKFLLQYLDLFICISEDGLNFMRQHYFQYAHKMQLSLLGIPGRTSSKATPFKPKPSVFHLVSISYIHKVKRVALILDALLALPAHIHIQWTHIGDGVDYASLNERVKMCNSPNLDIQLLGYLPHAEVMNFYENNDISCLINTSSSEGLPFSMMEALSFGVPIIGTDVGGVREIIEHEHNGLLLPPNPTAQEIAAAIMQIYLMSNNVYEQLQRNARNIWEQRFDAAINYPLFIQKIKSL